MDSSYLSLLKSLEKIIEKNIEKIENFPEKQWDDEFFAEISKDFEYFKENLEKSKSLVNNRNEEAFVKQYQTNYNKLKSRYTVLKKNIEEKRGKSDLFGNASEINLTHTDVLLKEGKSLDNTLEISYSVIKTAEEVKGSLKYQKEKLLSTSDKIVKFVETIPGINSVIGKISLRKRFNAIVIGITLFICMIITIIYVTR